jgi:hypothetical protein
MRVHLIFIIYLLTTIAGAQTEDTKVVANITTFPVDEGEVTLLHLGPGYTTSVRLSEEVSSVVIGDPANFKAEHSEVEPRLVFFKPLTTKPSETNALITTKSGHAISLQLVSAGKTATNARVDFVVEYRRGESLVIPDSHNLLIPDTGARSPSVPAASPVGSIAKPDRMTEELEKEELRGLTAPSSGAQELVASVGATVERDGQTMVGFSVINRSRRVVELLPPQLELASPGRGQGAKGLKAEPIAIAEYRMTTRRLEPGERADGVVAFERPAFKESREKLQLELAESEQVDRPIVLPVPFTAGNIGGSR